MSRFPLHQLLADEPLPDLPVMAQARRHVLRDDHPAIDKPTTTVVKTRHPAIERRRQLITAIQGEPTTNQRVLDALAHGGSLDSTQLRQITGMPKEYIFRALGQLRARKLITRIGAQRSYRWMINRAAPPDAEAHTTHATP